jgi:4-hydroxy-tetrahydrodipicolinate reductase
MRVGIGGAAGRMGRAIARVALATPGVAIAAAVEHAGHPMLGRDIGEAAGAAHVGVAISSDLARAIQSVDVWIDFSSPAGSVAAAESAATRAVAVVIGTTGLTAEERQAIVRAAERSPVVLSANMSVGVNVLAELCGRAAQLLGPGFAPEIVEIHHGEKKDAPSGTALLLGEAVCFASGRSLAGDAVYGRHGAVGARPPREIGLHALRGGDVVGDHTVFFLGPGERIELAHRASSRETFAHGAVRAAVWVAGRPPSLYDMRDVLGLTRS